MRFILPIGDYGGDGHGQWESCEIETDAPDLNAVSVCFRKAINNSFDIREVCADYEDNRVHVNHPAAKYAAQVPNIILVNDEYEMWTDDCAHLWALWLTDNSEYTFKPVSTNTLMFYPGSIGYGVYRC